MAHIFTTPQVARIFDVSEAQVRAWIETSGLKTYNTPGGKNRFTEVALGAFIRAFPGMDSGVPALEAALRRKDKAPGLGLRRAKDDPRPRKKRRRKQPPAQEQ